MTRAGCLLLALLVLAPLGTALGASFDEDDPRVRRIDGNDALAAMAKRQGWKGIGSASQPYRMQVADVVLDDVSPLPYLSLANTDLHVRIEGLSIASISRANVGIQLYRVSNVTIVRAELDHLGTGILVQDSYDVDVIDSRIRHSASGVRIVDSTDVSVRGLRADINDRAFALSGDGSLGNRFSDNVIANAEDQFAFFFETARTERFPWDNEIENSTIVNGEPIRWFHGLAGTERKPVVVRDLEIHGPGLTNLAQVACYRCLHVVFENATISGGMHGLVLIEGKHVRIQDAQIEETGTAIELFHGHKSAVIGGKLTSTQEGVRVVEADGTRIEGLRVERHEGGAAIAVENAGDVGVSRVEIRGGGRGLTASDAPRLVVSDLDVAGGQEGVRLSRSAEARLERVNVSDVKLTGVSISGSPEVVLTDVAVHGARGTGISLTQSRDSLVTRANVSSSGNGIVVERSSDTRVADARVRDNRLVGIVVREQVGTEIVGSEVERNAGGGISLERSGASALRDLVLADNGAAGIRLQEARPASELARIALTNHSRGVELAGSPDNRFRDVSVHLVGPQTGFHFSDAASYDVDLDTSNSVDGKPVHWITRPVGTPQAPLVLRELEASGGRFTNVGQIVVYRASHVVVEAARADGGAAGLFVYGSANVTVAGGDFERNDVGVVLSHSRGSTVRGVDVGGNGVGVRLTDTATSRVTEIAAHRAGIGVELVGASRQNEVDRIDASNVTLAPFVDAFEIPGDDKANFIVDAGLDQLVLPNATTTFVGAKAIVPYDHEPIVHERWDFGDGESAESEAGPPFRPAHVYAAEGNYTATYTVRTASGRVFEDSARVLVWLAPNAPRNLTVNGTGGVARLSWNGTLDGRVTYEVLRAEGDGDLVPIALLANATSYLDNTAKENATYRYEIRAHRGPLASEPAAAKPTRVQGGGALGAILAQAGIDADGFSEALSDLSASPNDPDAAAALLDAAGVRSGGKDAAAVLESSTATEETDGSVASQGSALSWIVQPNKRMQLLLAIGGIALIVLLLAQSTRR